MQVDEFISALLQHIPESQFKMIRYYGAYARKQIKCPYCGGETELAWYCKKPPPLEVKSQRELSDWISSSSLKFGKN